ncbi:hypothetical protein P171DRAFT_437687 [Karstenula rhodostoma CBS 690.94]|uniref:Uncharacterized protein n=1 Tax=Karstenula rhodostoma CBS 690.94 TaxID=1392251 RepID=A0A9P4P5J6_9PLEO|nr:hypothetical protein P171DRAFT_437687 [Karstenula rhodostoma CBS 690.94]
MCGSSHTSKQTPKEEARRGSEEAFERLQKECEVLRVDITSLRSDKAKSAQEVGRLKQELELLRGETQLWVDRARVAKRALDSFKSDMSEDDAQRTDEYANKYLLLNVFVCRMRTMAEEELSNRDIAKLGHNTIAYALTLRFCALRPELNDLLHQGRAVSLKDDRWDQLVEIVEARENDAGIVGGKLEAWQRLEGSPAGTNGSDNGGEGGSSREEGHDSVPQQYEAFTRSLNPGMELLKRRIDESKKIEAEQIKLVDTK